MGDEQEVGTGRRPRRWRTVSEKRIRQSNAPCFTAGFGDALDS
jgi:hypothetical protein